MAEGLLLRKQREINETRTGGGPSNGKGNGEDVKLSAGLCGFNTFVADWKQNNGNRERRGFNTHAEPLASLGDKEMRMGTVLASKQL